MVQPEMAEEKDSKATLGEEIIIDPAEVVGLDDEKPLQDDVKAGKRGRVLKAYNVLEDPEVIVVPDFVNEAEIQHLLQLAERGWQPSEVGSGVYKSKDEAKDLANEVSDIRTSYSCLIEPGTSNMVTAIEYRLATLAGMDVKHLEPLNMVRYAPGQFFKEHHDGRFRPKTVFLYLNDVPPGEGGETMFPDLNVKIVPRRGCAAFSSDWWAEHARLMSIVSGPSWQPLQPTAADFKLVFFVTFHHAPVQARSQRTSP
ncbi:unnamed protein product [Effrenium voratum]|nr:unnamed protein product [Effrenium voratum]